MLYWIVLVIAGGLEAVWATALDKSEWFSRLVPSTIFVVGLVASMACLGFALRGVPVGTAYAVWVGIGVTGTTVYAMVTGAEPVTLIKILLIMGLIGCVIGLRLISGPAGEG
jgi:quaternary ammonium compound-resistance protein SugE